MTILKIQNSKFKIQNKSKIQSSKQNFFCFVLWTLCLFCALDFVFCHSVLAQDNNSAGLSKQISDAKDNYFKDHKYSEFVTYLKSLAKKKDATPAIDYYTALARYQQLKYLEEKQLWDEYFSQGNDYRDELTRLAQRAIDATTDKDPLNIYARLLLWQFHKDQQDAFEEPAMMDLMGAASAYASSEKDLAPIKEAADKFLAYGEKGPARQLYKAYAQSLISSGIQEDALAAAAKNFLKDGNLELSENLFDAYADKVVKSASKEEAVSALTEIAATFAYRDGAESDPSYAERIFKRLEAFAGKEALGQDLAYLRAYNLEKAKEYAEARDAYVDLTSRFPEVPQKEEALYKAGLISAYGLRDIARARSYFVSLTPPEKEATAYSILGLYQLGLLSQWEQDEEGARGYYNKLIESAKGDFSDTVQMAQLRLKEIEEKAPLEYNLKTFLDLSLKAENALFDGTKLNLTSVPYAAKKGQDVSVASTAYTAPTGCMQVELQYLWSGHLGKDEPGANQPSFSTSYKTPGTKEINLVVVSPAGALERAFDTIDVR
jgi:hypothetical protein